MANTIYRDVNGRTGWKGLLGDSGKTYGNMRMFNQQELADALADGISVVPEPLIEEKSLAEVKDIKKQQINAYKKFMFDAGVEFNGVLFQSDTEARENVNGLVTHINAGMPLPDGFTFRALDNTDIPMDEATVKAFGAAMLANKHAQLKKSWALKAAVDAATTKAEVDTVVWDEYEAIIRTRT